MTCITIRFWWTKSNWLQSKHAMNMLKLWCMWGCCLLCCIFHYLKCNRALWRTIMMFTIYCILMNCYFGCNRIIFMKLPPTLNRYTLALDSCLEMDQNLHARWIHDHIHLLILEETHGCTSCHWDPWSPWSVFIGIWA